MNPPRQQARNLGTAMTRDEILERFRSLSVWKREGQRAPHKPLLLLLALARISRGEARAISFRDIDEPLKALLREFGPPRKSVHPEYPFWHLQSDGVWLVRDAELLERRTGNKNVTRNTLLKAEAVGELTEDVDRRLRRDPRLLAEAAGILLEAHFPHTLHEDILAAVGLDLAFAGGPARAKRDPAFREKVLRAYEYRCAVCGFDLRLGTADLALEAAHIKWHQAGGPDIESNGLALCTLHHKLFDRGAFTLSDERRVVVSERVYGRPEVKGEVLGRYVGAVVGPPQRDEYLAGVGFLGWHRGEVFV